MQIIAFAHKWAFHQHETRRKYGFDVNNKDLLTKSRRKKKRKSEIIQKAYVFSVKMPKVSQNAESVANKKKPRCSRAFDSWASLVTIQQT